MNSKDHKLFKHFPLQSSISISTGNVSIPYHIYDGFGLFIGGSCDLDATKHLLQNEDMLPVRTSDGKALMGIWVCNFMDANLGPHHELQFSIFVSQKEIEPTPVHPFNAHSSPLIHPEVKMMCHGLWNNTPTVVAYNRELLNLNALLSEGEIRKTGEKIEFTIADAITKKRLISGAVKTTPTLKSTFSFMSSLGLRSFMTLANQPWANMQVINPKGVGLNRNAAANAYSTNDKNVFRLFDFTDELKIEHPEYGSLNFIPSGIQYMEGIKFVYLLPG